MPASIDRARIHHIAKLASLSLTDDEAEKLAHELDAIVQYVAQLDSLDTTNVEATANVQGGSGAWREDLLQPGLSRDQALAEAPKVEDDAFAVPAFVE